MKKMTPAELLESAADKLDGLARNDLTPGPWIVRFECPEGEHHCDWDEVWIAGRHGSTVAGFNERYTCAPRDAAYVAAVSPQVGKAIAAWLRASAKWDGPVTVSDAAVKVARLILERP